MRSVVAPARARPPAARTDPDEARPVNRPAPLRAEPLEARDVPALFGNPWPDADRLSVSFAPDGTDVAGAQSNLFATLNAVMPTPVWQGEIVRAFQSWAAVTNVNVRVVSDNGAAFGAAGPVQGSAYYGDIRISARPLSANVIAVSTPFDVFNSWAGEIVVNSDKLFAQGDAAGRYDLYTALVQEAGHALGLDNSPDTSSVMYTTYTAARTGLSAGDAAAIQKLYGVRATDAFDAAGAGNNTLASADAITFVTDADKVVGDGTAGAAPMVAAGDLTTLADDDYYAYKVPKGQTEFAVALLTDGIGQLRAKVTVYDAANKVVKEATVPVGFRGAFQVPVTGAKADSTYRVKVEGATEDVFGIGAYRLAVGKPGEVVEAVTPPAPSAYLFPDNHTNDTRDKAVPLGDARPAADARWDFVAQGSIYNAGGVADYDFYKVHTKKDTQKVAVFGVSALDVGALSPSVEVYDKNGVKLAVEVLSNTGGTVVVQLVNVAPDTDYFVRVGAAGAGQGNYGLAIDFRDAALALPTFAAGTFQGAANQAATAFAVTRTQLVYFEAAGTGSADAAVRLTVYDQNNVAVLTVVAKGGEVAGRDVLLQPGTYTVRFVAATRDGSPLPAFQFRGRYNLGTDPIGPELIDGTAPPANPAPVPQLYAYNPSAGTTLFLAPSPVYTAPVGTPGGSPVVWLAPPPPASFYQSVATDIYSRPWW